MSPLRMIRFIARCLMLDEFPELSGAIGKKLKDKQFPVNEFILACNNQLVLPAVTLKLQRAGLLSLLPDGYADHLVSIVEKNCIRNREILQQAEEISGWLSQQGIETVFMKGTALLIDGLYKDPGERLVGDMDVLVPVGRLQDAIRIISGKGYLTQTDYPDSDDLSHYPRLYRADVPADIELHRYPVHLSHLAGLEPETVFRRKKRGADQFPECFTMDVDQQVIQNFKHIQLSHHAFRDKFIALRDLYDLYLLAGKTDLHAVYAQIQEKRMARYYFMTAGDLFGLSPRMRFHKWKTSGYYWFLLQVNQPWIHRFLVSAGRLRYLLMVAYVNRLTKFFLQKSYRDKKLLEFRQKGFFLQRWNAFLHYIRH